MRNYQNSEQEYHRIHGSLSATLLGMFLRQIVLQKGIPFEMKLPRTAPLTYGSLAKEQFDKEIEKGMSDVKAGRVYSADAIEAEMKRDFGI